MTKEILLSIKGLQFLEDNNEDEIEVITTGTYFQKDGRHYIKYDEVMEGLEGKIQNLIKINKKSMEVTKRGLSNVHMVFEENKRNVTYYDTPFGNLLVGIAATNIDLNESKDIIDVKVNYALEVNYEHLADCTISMNIQAKHMKRPHLLQ